MKKGSHHSEKTKEGISKNSKGKQSREKHYNWKGVFARERGYILYKLPEEHEYFCMCTKQGYVRFHRLVMAVFLQRPLTDKEVVHHINGDMEDNRIENLELFGGQGKHSAEHGIYEAGMFKNKKEYDERYRVDNKEKIKVNKKKYYNENCKEILKNQKQYRMEKMKKEALSIGDEANSEDLQ